MTDEMSLKSIWEGLAEADRFSRIQRVGSAMGLPQYCAVDGSGNYAFYTKSKVRPERFEQLANLSVTVAQDKDGEWTRAITLTDADFFEEFSILVDSLVSVTVNKLNEAVALRSQEIAFEQWVAFYKRRQGFNLSTARGLFGELLVLEMRQKQHAHTWTQTLENWKGPFGNPQDFVLDKDIAEEVKTVNTSAKRVRINGADQLTFPGRLTLTVLKVRDSADKNSGQTLVEMIDRLRMDLTPAQRELLKERLDLVGFDGESELATSRYFELANIDSYAVTSEFPKIDESSLPEGVSGVEYYLKLSAIEAFKSNGGGK